MKIACDLDDVIFDFVPGFCSFYEEYSGRRFKKEDFYSYNFWEIIGGSRDAAIYLVDHFYDSKHFDDLKVIEGAKEGLTAVSNHYGGIIITARPKRFRNKTQFALHNKLNLQDIPLYYSNGEHDEGINKGDICSIEKVDIIIDDNISHALDCERKGISVLLFDNPWNKDFKEKEHMKMKRIYDWSQIMAEIKRISKGGIK